MTDTKREAPASLEKRAAALEIVLRRKADMPKNFVAEFTEHADDAWITANGAQMVARAWTDPEYRARMLVDGTAAARELDSCWGYLPGECWGRETSIKVVGGFANSIPDMKFDIKEILVAGDRVVVRGEVTGTPAGDLFGVPHMGKSFRIMAVDIQTIRDGKIARTYHLENWLSALRQLRDK